jgi:hypothetical protein
MWKASFSHEFMASWVAVSKPLLGTLSLSEGILLPRVHGELGGSQQTLQRKLGRIGRIFLEGLLQITLEQSVGAIILVRLMEVSEDPFEFAEEQRLRIGWPR